jgi:hypothetical protein
MSTVAKRQKGAALPADEQYRMGASNFDWAMTGLSAWLIGGIEG